MCHLFPYLRQERRNGGCTKWTAKEIWNCLQASSFMAEYKLFIKDFYSLLYIARLAAAKFSVLAKKSLVIYMREIALCMLKAAPSLRTKYLQNNR